MAINGPGGDVSGRGSLIGTGGGSDGGVSGIWSGSVGSSGSSRIGSSGTGPGLFLFNFSTANRNASGVPSVNLAVRVLWLHPNRADTRFNTGGNDGRDGLSAGVEPAYRYGFESAHRYEGRNWNDIESQLSTNWTTYEHRTKSTWEEIKGAVRDAWDRVTGRRPVGTR
jgi:hypothetical protein